MPRRAAGRGVHNTRRAGRARRRGQAGLGPGSPWSKSAPGRASNESSSCRTACPPLSAAIARMTVTPCRRSDRRMRITLPGNASSVPANGGRQVGVGDRVSAPGSAHLDEQPACRLGGVRERLPGGERRLGNKALALTPATCRRAVARARDRCRARPQRPGTRRRPSPCRDQDARRRGGGRSSACARAR